MPEISQLEWVLQLSTACSLCSAVAGMGSYLIFKDRHRRSLSREEQLRNERINAEQEMLRIQQLEAYTPLYDPNRSPYRPAQIPKAPPAVVFDVDGVPIVAAEKTMFRSTTETVVNPPLLPRRSKWAPTPSPLASEADEDTRKHWADLVGPDVPAWATTTDMQHLVSGGGVEDEEPRGRHGAFRIATA
jgi:hypothetical protein